MPQMDGLEVLRQIRAMRPHIPVLMLTGKEFSIPRAIQSMAAVPSWTSPIL